MVELLLLALIITIVVLSIRRGKPPVLDTPLIIQRLGQYHITLAPQLNRAQTFIEQIASQFALSPPPQGDLPSQFFEVHDRNVPAQNGGFYLLVVAYRGGLLYFQAINPQPLLRDADSHLKQLRTFSEAVLALHPLDHPAHGDEVEKLRSAVAMAAQKLQITVKILTDTDL